MLRDVMDAREADGAKADAAPRVREKIASFMIGYCLFQVIYEKDMNWKIHKIFELVDEKGKSDG